MKKYIVLEKKDIAKINVICSIYAINETEANQQLDTLIEEKQIITSSFRDEFVLSEVNNIPSFGHQFFGKVEAEFVDNDKIFKWRLKCNGEFSPWYSFYPGLLVHKFHDGRTFCLATQNWTGYLPTEIPFEIILPEVQNDKKKV